MPQPPPTRILVIDEIPLIAAGLKEILRRVHPDIFVEHTAGLYTALSAESWAGKHFDLVIVGNYDDGNSAGWQQIITELKNRFGQPRVMIYSSTYDPLIIKKMSDAGIDAYVHKHESIDEILRALQQLSAGKPFISAMFHTLYYDYGYGAGN